MAASCKECTIPPTSPPCIAILGAGPIGLEAALQAMSLKLPVTVYERGRVAENLRQWGHVRLFSPFGMNCTPLGRSTIKAELSQHTFPADGDCITGREHVSAYLEPLAKCSLLKDRIKEGFQVLGISRRGMLKTDSPGETRRAAQPFRLLVRDSRDRERIEEADVVIDCTGTYGVNRWMGDGGIPAIGERAQSGFISYGLDDVLGERRSTYAGKNILVIGGGYSAATTVCNLAALADKEPSTWVVWLARCGNSQPIRRHMNDPLPERDRLAQRANMLATRTDGNVEFRNQACIESLESADGGVKVTARIAGKATSWTVERVIANVGYAPDAGLYRELQVHECYASQGPMGVAAALLKHGAADCLAVPPLGANVLKTPEPNFYVLGAKSYGRNSHFLLKNGFEQVRDVFTLIVGKTGR